MVLLQKKRQKNGLTYVSIVQVHDSGRCFSTDDMFITTNKPTIKDPEYLELTSNKILTNVETSPELAILPAQLELGDASFVPAD